MFWLSDCLGFLFLDLGMDDEGDDDPVPLPNVNAAILKKVRIFYWCCIQHDGSIVNLHAYN